MTDSVHIAEPDFLTRIIDKAVGIGTGLEPRLPSLFEPPQRLPVRGGHVSNKEPVPIADPTRDRFKPAVGSLGGGDPKQFSAPVWRYAATARPDADANRDDQPPVVASPDTRTPRSAMPALVTSVTDVAEPPILALRADLDPTAKRRPPLPLAPEGQSLRPLFRGGEFGTTRPLAGDDKGVSKPPSFTARGNSAATSEDSAATSARDVATVQRGARGATARAVGPATLVVPLTVRSRSERDEAVRERANAPQVVEIGMLTPNPRAPLPTIGVSPPTGPHRSERGEPASVRLPPVVNVTIGQVEVRAVPAPRAEKLRSETRGARPMSLDEYLRRRESGR